MTNSATSLALQNLIRTHRDSICFLTGAGISTDSGIPDYRGPNGVYMRNKGYKPITYQQFIGSHEFRQRYWARSFLGWPNVRIAKPNTSHSLISEYQTRYPNTKLLTQNVDGLHTQSGFKNAIEMHGTLYKVHCLSCKESIDRDEFQTLLTNLNPIVDSWAKQNPDKIEKDVSSSVNPDGDVEINWDYSQFQYPKCISCNTGVYKPSVVFFGENMLPETKDQTYNAIKSSKLLVTVGTSLTVYSAYRLLKYANDLQIPIVLINLGETRGDALATLKLNVPCREALDSISNI
ncbi:DHS-like NAD/FAD-binding domain-containing protein [Globomyces pollinis-pini]|nr:DHS-like NAD/FAD-binding domain-containing protein [Globomyces pollinis-pini]